MKGRLPYYPSRCEQQHVLLSPVKGGVSQRLCIQAGCVLYTSRYKRILVKKKAFWYYNKAHLSKGMSASASFARSACATPAAVSSDSSVLPWGADHGRWIDPAITTHHMTCKVMEAAASTHGRQVAGARAGPWCKLVAALASIQLARLRAAAACGPPLTHKHTPANTTHTAHTQHKPGCAAARSRSRSRGAAPL